MKNGRLDRIRQIVDVENLYPLHLCHFRQVKIIGGETTVGCFGEVNELTSIFARPVGESASMSAILSAVGMNMGSI